MRDFERANVLQLVPNLCAVDDTRGKLAKYAYRRDNTPPKKNVQSAEHGLLSSGDITLNLCGLVTQILR